MARRRKRCKYGKLKNPVGKRICRKCPKGAFKRCRYGKLKTPTKSGRICKKRRGRTA